MGNLMFFFHTILKQHLINLIYPDFYRLENQKTTKNSMDSFSIKVHAVSELFDYNVRPVSSSFELLDLPDREKLLKKSLINQYFFFFF